MKDPEMSGDTVYFCTDHQNVSLKPPGSVHQAPPQPRGNSQRFRFLLRSQLCGKHGADPKAAAPAAPRAPRLLRATLAFLTGILVFSVIALFAVALQSRSPEVEEHPSTRGTPVYKFQHGFPEFQHGFLEDNTTEPSPVVSSTYQSFDGAAEMQETLQMFRGYVENSSTWHMEVQLLTYRVDNVSSQIQVLGDHLEDANANLQVVKDMLKEANTLSLQTQTLRSALEGANAEIQRLKGDLEKANALTFQTQDFLERSSANTSIGLHLLNRGLESANTEIQVLKAGLEMANTQARLANSSLKDANTEIQALRGQLDSVDDLRNQDQIFRSILEGAQAEIQRLNRSLQNANALNFQTQTFLKGSLDNTTAEMQLLRGHLERADDETHLLKRDLGAVTAQTQRANRRLEETDAQIQVLKAELKNASALNSQVQALEGQLENASREIQTLKGGMKDDAVLHTQIQTLKDNMQKASAEMQRLNGELENTKTLIAKIQEEQRPLGTLPAAFASLEQLQRTQNELLQLALQNWKVYKGNLYYFSYSKKPWNEAEQACVSLGAHLASVTSPEEQAFLAQFTSAFYHWIGLTDRGTEGSWRWVDGTPFSASQSKAFWDKNQPDNWKHSNGQTEDCIHIQQLWNDMDCTVPYHWICKKPQGLGVA